MRRASRRWTARIYKAGKPALDGLLGASSVLGLRAIRHFDPAKTARVTGWLARKVAPLLPEHEIARSNLVAAFPEKSPHEIDSILRQSWDNLGRFCAEFANLDRIWNFDAIAAGQSNVEISARTQAIFDELLNDGCGALIFSAHLGNWELPALAAPAHGLKSAVLYRRPNIASIDQAVRDIRSVNMGDMIPTAMDAPIRLADALKSGAHVGMLVDQHYTKGVDVTFFGRAARANPLLARLARQVECPIHGVRIIRLPNGRFRAEITERVEPVRHTDGSIDVQATTQTITSIIEGWIREYPDQWLWQHRRWR